MEEVPWWGWFLWWGWCPGGDGAFQINSIPFPLPLTDFCVRGARSPSFYFALVEVLPWWGWCLDGGVALVGPWWGRFTPRPPIQGCLSLSNPHSAQWHVESQSPPLRWLRTLPYAVRAAPAHRLKMQV